MSPSPDRSVDYSTAQRYEELVASINGIVWEADARTFQFTFVSQQAERLLGYPVGKWLAPNFWVDHLHPDDRKPAVEFCLRATREKRSHDFEYRMIAADGRAVWLRDIVSVIVQGDDVSGLRGVMVDVTDQKRTAEILSASNQLLEMIATNAPLGDTLARLAYLIEGQADGMACSVLLLDADGVHVRHGAAPSLPESYVKLIDGLAIGPRAGSCGTAMY